MRTEQPPPDLPDLPDPDADAARDDGRRTGRTVVLGVLVVAALLAGTVALVARPGPGEAAGIAAPGAVPFADRPEADEAFPLPERTVDGFAGGDPVDLAGYRGRPLVVNFWATWCAPCVEEMPDFDVVAREVEAEAAFLGVDVQDAPRRAEPFAEELGIGYDLAVDAAAELYAEVGGFGMPTTLFVDADGTVVYRHTGPLDASRLRAMLREHLAVG